MQNSKLTSVLVKYNNENMGTWKKHSEKSGKDFYSINVPAKQASNRISFILQPKFVYTDEKKNKETGTIGNQNIYIMKEWEYNLNVYNVDSKVGTNKKITGVQVLDLIKANVTPVEFIQTTDKKEEADVEASIIGL